MKASRIIHTTIILWLYICSVAYLGVQSRRIRRRLDEFGEMILETTERNPMDFNGYGNWCGFGGEGETVDGIDQCCKEHDACYLELNRSDCDTLLKYKIYTTTYTWSIKRGEIICDDDDPCSGKLCKCDKTAAKCFGRHKQEYNPGNKHNGLLTGIKRLISG